MLQLPVQALLVVLLLLLLLLLLMVVLLHLSAQQLLLLPLQLLQRVGLCSTAAPRQLLYQEQLQLAAVLVAAMRLQLEQQMVLRQVHRQLQEVSVGQVAGCSRRLQSCSVSKCVTRSGIQPGMGRGATGATWG